MSIGQTIYFLLSRKLKNESKMRIKLFGFDFYKPVEGSIEQLLFDIEDNELIDLIDKAIGKKKVKTKSRKPL